MLRILAFDIGEKRIGVAVSDPLGITAQGIETYHRTEDLEQDVAHLIKLANGYKPVKIVFGLPRNMDGSEGERAQKCRKVAQLITNILPDIPVEMWDERNSTKEAILYMNATDTRGKKRKETLDAAAASIILEGFLAYRKNMQNVQSDNK